MQPSNLARSLVSLVGGGLGVAVLAVALLAIEPLLVPVLLAGAIPQTLLSRRQGSIEFDFIVRQSAGHRVRDYFVELLTGRDEAKEVRAFDLGEPVERRWEKSYQAYIDELRAHVVRRVRLAMLSSLVTFLVTAAALALLVAVVLDDTVGLAAAGAALIAIRLTATRMEMPRWEPADTGLC